MTWNYRIIKKHIPVVGMVGVVEVDESYDIMELHEVYYDERNKPYAATETPIVVGDTVEEIIDVLKIMLKDVEKSKDHVLTEEEILENGLEALKEEN